MPIGLKKHLKKLNDPKHWNLDKFGGAFAPKPSSGPHKARECLPWVSLPKGEGIKLSIIEEARKRLAAQSAAPA